MDIKNKNLAINGGTPVSQNPIIIHKPYLDEEDFQAINRAARSTFVSGNGPSCMEFEKKLSEFLNVKHVLFTNSCTTALDLAFKAKNFSPGSQVIVPNFTYTSTALGPLLNNLNIKLVDVNSNNGNLDPLQIKQAINSLTVAIIPVDYSGNPVDMDSINKIAHEFNLWVVHDVAQSIGATYKGIKAGTFGDVSTFSFHGTKNITTGEGGALITNNDELAEKALLIREKGTNKQSFLMDNKTRGFYEYETIGSSFVQSNILGALGISQLEKISLITKKRKRIADFYKKELRELTNISFIETTIDSEPNWHIFGILVDPKYKYWIMDALRAEGIMANVHYTPLHRNKFYFGEATDDQMKGSMNFYNRLLRLPIYPSLTQEEQNKIVEATIKVLSSI